MIVYLDEVRRADWLALCGSEPVIGARMQTVLAAYGLNSGIADYWLALDADGLPAAALMRFDGWVVAVADCERLILPELGDFLQTIGEFRFLEGSPALAGAVAKWVPGALEMGSTMRYNGGYPPGDTGISISGAPPLQEVYNLIRSGSAFMASTTRWEAWYPHTSHLIRHGLGFAAVLYEPDGFPASTGGVYAIGGEYGVIGSLATDPERRGRGYAARIVRHLCARCIDRGLVPVLFCASRGLVAYYQRLGFAVNGQWAQIERAQP